MEPSGSIEPQAWMEALTTRAVLEALSAEGTTVRFVGGCVRDALAGRPVKDIDIATPDAPERVMALLGSAGLEAVATGLEHGTITAIADHRAYEITTLRRDVETYGRHAKVAFTDDWRQDASRRDFTINAMFLDPDGTLFDPFGGRQDLEAGRVRFVGDASARIEEDYLRLLRFFRFHAHYGRGGPDGEALEAAVRLKHGLERISGERITTELFRMLEAGDPAGVAEVMVARRVLAAVLPGATRSDRLRQLVEIESGDIDALRRFAALLDERSADPDSVAERLRLSGARRDRLRALLSGIGRVGPGLARHRWSRLLYREGPDMAGDLVRLSWAEARTRGEDAAWYPDALAEARSWQPVDFPLKGRDLLALGLPPGRDVGRLLRELETWWLERDLRPGRETLLAEAARRIGRAR